MSDRELRHIATAWCTQFKCYNFVYIQDKHPSGRRILVVQSDRGPSDLRIADNGRREFAFGLADYMTDQDVLDRWFGGATVPAGVA